MDRPSLHMPSFISSLNIHFNIVKTSASNKHNERQSGCPRGSGHLWETDLELSGMLMHTASMYGVRKPGEGLGWALWKTKSMSAKAHEKMRSSTIIIPLEVGSSMFYC